MKLKRILAALAVGTLALGMRQRESSGHFRTR